MLLFTFFKTENINRYTLYLLQIQSLGYLLWSCLISFTIVTNTLMLALFIIWDTGFLTPLVKFKINQNLSNSTLSFSYHLFVLLYRTVIIFSIFYLFFICLLPLKCFFFYALLFLHCVLLHSRCSISIYQMTAVSLLIWKNVSMCLYAILVIMKIKLCINSKEPFKECRFN